MTFTLDAAGNRTEVSTIAPPGTPSSITVPASSTTGAYTIDWGAASGSVTGYELYEATNSNFNNPVQAYSGALTSRAISGRSDGTTYYYRVRACYVSACSGYRTGGNGVTVTLPPGTPASISVPSSSTTGSYTISWGTSSGTVSSYKLYEASNSSFSGQTLAYSGTARSKAISGKGNGHYYYRVRGCNASGCSGYRTGGNSVDVTLPPGTPPSISVPSSSTTGSYTISWGASSGTVTAYKLYEATTSTFSGQTLVYNGTARSKAISGKGSGHYYYRVRGCNASGCSGYRTGSNGTTVTLPPDPPADISGPARIFGDSYTISWSSSAGATRYVLWQSSYGVYDGPATHKSFSGMPSGSYMYKVKACNGLCNVCSVNSVTFRQPVSR